MNNKIPRHSTSVITPQSIVQMDNASQSLTAYRHYEQDAISDSSAELPNNNNNNNTRTKRSWLNDSHENTDEQDTLMSGDDSLSSCCSILEVRPLKRLRINDNQPQRASSQMREVQHFRNKLNPIICPVSISISDGASIRIPTVRTEGLTSHPPENTPPSFSPWSDISRRKQAFICSKKEVGSAGVVPVEEGTGVSCNLHTTVKMQESNEYSGFNRVLGNLHMHRRNHHPIADPMVEQNNNVSVMDNSLCSHSENFSHEPNARNNVVSQRAQTQYHQRQTKDAPNWKRQIRLQSNSQLY